MLKVCGYGHRYQGRRCPTCRRSRATAYGAEHVRVGGAAIEADPRCAGTPAGPCRYADAGTPTNPLTRGHRVAVSRGGARSGYVVQCNRCNSGQRDRHG